MVCGVCKKSIPEAAKFCVHCGAKVEAAAPEEVKPVEQKAPVVAPAPVTQKKAADKVSSAPDVTAASAADVPKDAPGTASEQPKASNALMWIIVIAILLSVSAAGGYVVYNKFVQKDEPKTDMMAAGTVTPDQPQTPGVPSVPAAPGSPAEPAMQQSQPGQMSQQGQTPPQYQEPVPQNKATLRSRVMQSPPPAEQYPPSQSASNVSIKASALTSDVVNGKPAGLSKKFKYGKSRVAHYVQYAKVIPGQTIFTSEFYKDGSFLFKCGSRPLQNPAGNYFCRPQQDLEAGNYEVRFSIDGMPKPTLRFTVIY